MCILLYAVSKVLCMYQTSSETSEAPFYLSLKKQNRGYVSMKRKTVQKAGAVSAAVIYDIRIFVRDGKGKTESKPLQLTVTK